MLFESDTEKDQIRVLSSVNLTTNLYGPPTELQGQGESKVDPTKP